MLKKNLISFKPTTFFQKLTLYFPKTNSYSNRFFFELDTTLNQSLPRFDVLEQFQYRRITQCDNTLTCEQKEASSMLSDLGGFDSSIKKITAS